MTKPPKTDTLRRLERAAMRLYNWETNGGKLRSWEGLLRGPYGDFLKSCSAHAKAKAGRGRK